MQKRLCPSKAYYRLHAYKIVVKKTACTLVYLTRAACMNPKMRPYFSGFKLFKFFQCCRLVSCQDCCSLCTDLENLKFKTFKESRILLSDCVHAMTSSKERRFLDFGYLHIKEKLSLSIILLSLNLKKKYQRYELNSSNLCAILIIF